MITQPVMQYYTGDTALGLEPTAGTWVTRNLFMDPAGFVWQTPADLDDADLQEGSGVVYLIKAKPYYVGFKHGVEDGVENNIFVRDEDRHSYRIGYDAGVAEYCAKLDNEPQP